MENASREELRRWVAEQMSCLDTPSAPDHGAALARFRARLASDRRRGTFRSWHAWAAAVALAASTFALLPGGRALADQFWQMVTMRRVAIVRVKPWPEGVPSPAIRSTGIPIPPIPARDLEEARLRVHYLPRVPYGVFSGSPRISTTFSLAVGTTIKTADLELALARAGVTDQHVPAAWNGAQLAVHTSGIVLAEWPDILFAQSLPLTFTAPAGFDLSAFSALILRVVGVGPEEAQRLARKADTDPWWLAPLTPDLAAIGSFEEITLNSGPALLLEQKAGPWRGQKDIVTLLWSVTDRVYLLRGSIDRQLAIAAANSVQ